MKDEKLLEFGKEVLERLKDHYKEGWPSEEDEELTEIAHKFGLVERVPYDPELHGDVDAEPGDEIWLFPIEEYLAKNNGPASELEYGDVSRSIRSAIKKCPNEYTIYDIESAIREEGKIIPRHAISQCICRLARKNKINILIMGAGRRPTKFIK